MIMKLSDSSLIKTASYINGTWRDADSSFALNNPATGEKLADIADHGADAVREAIDIAAAAQKEWAALTAKDRAMLMRGWFNLVMENQEDLAQIITAEMGKPLADPVVRSPMAPLSSTGLPKKAAASPVMSCNRI